MISNSTPLISLAKVNLLHLLKDLFKKIYMPKAVKEEVIDQGKGIKAIDSFIVEDGIKEGWIIVKEVEPLPLLNNLGIDKGEIEAISLTCQMKKEILLDQTHARVAAQMFGLKPKGTIFVLLRALKKKKISYDEYLMALRDLIDVGFQMSQEVYLEAIKLGKETK